MLFIILYYLLLYYIQSKNIYTPNIDIYDLSITIFKLSSLIPLSVYLSVIAIESYSFYTTLTN